MPSWQFTSESATNRNLEFQADPAKPPEQWCDLKSEQEPEPPGICIKKRALNLHA